MAWLQRFLFSAIAMGCAATATAGVIEFHAGDRLPVSLKMDGDLLETADKATVYLTVKRAFWARTGESQIQLSLDGEHFRPLSEVVAGDLTVDASGEVASALSVALTARLR